MMRRNIIETVLGAVVLGVAALFLAFAYSSSTLHHGHGYELHANFSKIDGLSPGADVKISGVKVGSVTSTHLDPKTYLADVTMNIDHSIKVPKDSVAIVASEGFLGGKFMSVQIGGDPEMLEAGGKFDYTQSSPGLEQLLGQVIFSAAKGAGGNSSNNANSANPQSNNSAPASLSDSPEKEKP